MPRIQPNQVEELGDDDFMCVDRARKYNGRKGESSMEAIRKRTARFIEDATEGGNEKAVIGYLIAIFLKEKSKGNWIKVIRLLKLILKHPDNCRIDITKRELAYARRMAELQSNDTAKEPLKNRFL